MGRRDRTESRAPHAALLALVPLFLDHQDPGGAVHAAQVDAKRDGVGDVSLPFCSISFGFACFL